MGPDTIVGYTYDVEHMCPNCTADSMMVDWKKFFTTVENMLDFIAQYANMNPSGEVINRQKEDTFDSSTFPKVIFYSPDLADEQCAHCGEKLI